MRDEDGYGIRGRGVRCCSVDIIHALTFQYLINKKSNELVGGKLLGELK